MELISRKQFHSNAGATSYNDYTTANSSSNNNNNNSKTLYSATDIKWNSNI